MAKKEKASLTEAVSAELKKGFSLDKFKEKKFLKSNVKFKDQKWIPLSPALSQVISPIRKSGRNSNIVVFLFIILSIITNK